MKLFSQAESVSKNLEGGTWMETGMIFAFSIAVGSLGVAFMALLTVGKLEKRVKDLEKK
jgi:hypothetical protein